ncbi:hypothetical protein LLG10_00905 [bacterium]|nr:hypothetical protein [bacterium]
MVVIIILAILLAIVVFCPYLFFIYVSWKPLRFPFLYSIIWRIQEYMFISVCLMQILGTLQESLTYFNLFIPTGLYIVILVFAYIQVKKSPKFHYQGLNQPTLSSIELTIEKKLADQLKDITKADITHGLSYQSVYYYQIQNEPFLYVITNQENINNLKLELQFRPSEKFSHQYIAELITELNKTYLRMAKKNANKNDHIVLFWIWYYGLILTFFTLFFFKKYISTIHISQTGRLVVYFSLLFITLIILALDLIPRKSSVQ